MKANNCMRAQAKRRVTRPRVREDSRILYSCRAGQVRCCRSDSCLAAECIAQVFARRCGLDMRNAKDRKVICQLCSVYHAGYDAGFTAGYDYVLAAKSCTSTGKQIKQ